MIPRNPCSISVRLVRPLMLLCVVGVFPIDVRGGDVPEALRDRIGDDPDDSAVDSLDFILSLSLTRDQVTAILPLYKEACRSHLDNCRERAEILPRQVEAYTAFLEEDRLNQGFTAEVERTTARVHRRAREVREELVTDLNALAYAVRQVFTATQRAATDEYRPDRTAVLAAYGSPKQKQKAQRMARRRAGRDDARALDHQAELLAEVRRELNAINRAAHSPLDVVARYLLTPAAAETLYESAGTRAAWVVRDAVNCWRSGTSDYPAAQRREDEESIRALRKEINNWNLANGMQFDREQIEQLVDLAEEAHSLRSAQRQAKPKDKLPGDAFQAELLRLELAAESVLRPGQIEVLESYKPCLIPPKNLKDPVRVGQAADETRMVRWLARARVKNDEKVEQMIERLLERENAHVGPMDDDALAQRRQVLRGTVRRAALMSDVEFALNKDELADAIRPPDRRGELTADVDALRRERLQPGRTSRFLLNREFADVLRTRHEQLSP